MAGLACYKEVDQERHANAIILGGVGDGRPGADAARARDQDDAEASPCP